jgi:hypothetical protein
MITTTEADIAAVSTAPRVTPADLAANIASEHYFTAGEAVGVLGATHHPALDVLTFCILVLQNGFTVTGESACASPENFDAEIGRRIARENAVQKIWPLMGYQLKEQLHAAGRIGPTYYVRHPDDSYTAADPQPLHA